MKKFKILFNLPTRSRPEQFEKCLNKLVKAIGSWDEVGIIIKLDNDDLTLDKYLNLIHEIKYSTTFLLPIFIEYGKSPNKIAAQNRNIEKYDWDILVNWSDDIMAFRGEIEDEIRKPFEKHGLDWCPGFWDGYRQDELPVVAIIGREYFNRFGYMYYPGYESLYADNEMETVAKMLGRFEFIREPLLFTHEHPNNTGAPRDEMYNKNESPYYYEKDGALFEERRIINFGL